MATTESLLTRVREMEVGDQITVPVSAYGYNTVRRYASDCGLYMERSYSTHLDRETRTFTIIRNS